jgi:hypothetical protein
MPMEVLLRLIHPVNFSVFLLLAKKRDRNKFISQ